MVPAKGCSHMQAFKCAGVDDSSREREGEQRRAVRVGLDAPRLPNTTNPLPPRRKMRTKPRPRGTRDGTW